MMNADTLATLANSLVRVKALLNWDLAALAANQSGTPKAVTLQQHGTQPIHLDTKVMEELIAQQIHHHLAILRDGGVDVHELLVSYHDKTRELLAAEQTTS